ncbi:hypothetical protein ACT7DH_12270 [Bacillus pacificus]
MIIKHYEKLNKRNEGRQIETKTRTLLQDCNALWMCVVLDMTRTRSERFSKRRTFIGDRFCNSLCKKLKQAVRMSKFISTYPDLQKACSELTLTIPIYEGGENLQIGVDRMVCLKPLQS